ncbi:MAG: hypothetical protein HYU97_12285 [Deltaproteobacteria bacterium]|nr:hypothetical protein [Deltaproteobacteria bacterium]
MNERFSTHFENNEANRSQSVLLELMTLLGRYRKHLYLVGGWAPYFLLQMFQKPENDFQHIGSIDIDIAIDCAHIPQDEYARIIDLIEERGYTARMSRTKTVIPFSFERHLEGLDIAIDFLAGEYGGTTNQHRHQRVDDDLLARKARGADLLPDHHLDFKLSGYLPDGARQSCPIKMANIVSMLTMKGITISERYKEKDAYDIFSMIAHYKDGPSSCIAELKPHFKNKLVQEGLQSICDKFEFEDSVGSAWAAQFMAPLDEVESGMLRKDVYQRVRPFVEAIKKLL